MTRKLLERRFEDPEWWMSMQPYWDFLPDKSQIYNKHMFRMEHLPLFQDANFVSIFAQLDTCAAEHPLTVRASLKNKATV